MNLNIHEHLISENKIKKRGTEKTRIATIVTTNIVEEKKFKTRNESSKKMAHLKKKTGKGIFSFHTNSEIKKNKSHVILLLVTVILEIVIAEVIKENKRNNNKTFLDSDPLFLQNNTRLRLLQIAGT